MGSVNIELDAFPVIAYTPDGGRYEPARLTLADGVARVWVAAGGNPYAAFEQPYASLEGNRFSGYSVLTSSGMVTANPTGGCGCGSSLRSFDPYAGATRSFVG